MRDEAGGILIGAALVLLAWAVLILNVLQLGGDQAIIESSVVAMVVGGLGISLVVLGRSREHNTDRDRAL